MKISAVLILIFVGAKLYAQQKDSVWSFMVAGDCRVSIDVSSPSNGRHHVLLFYALPNGNTTEQTMGKKLQPGDDWHYDIQHIKAQTKFIRNELKKTAFTVVYLENNYKSWPAWKTKHDDYAAIIRHIVDTVKKVLHAENSFIYLNGHSGGGRFIFCYLDGVESIPAAVQKISFLDSDYGYESKYLQKILQWLKENKKASLTVFAYNDSVALYQGKRVVSDTGGTWYRSWMMLRDLSAHFVFRQTRNDSLIVFRSADKRIWFFFKTNPEQKIFHTTQVELNGFIHSVLCGTRRDSKHYRYYGPRAYGQYIE